MAAFTPTVEQFIDTYINGNPDVVKIATNDEEMDLIWESFKIFKKGGFGITRINGLKTHVIKQINIGGQIEQNGVEYAINNIRNEVLIYHYISQQCKGVCNFIGCYYHTGEQKLYVQSDYCGSNFHSILSSKSLDFDTKRKIFGKIIGNLNCLHDKGVVHRDIKPHNITVSNDNTVTFIDFGLSYLCEDAEVSDELKLNQQKRIRSTIFYADPTLPITDDEITEDHLKKTDIYSMGVLFVVMFLRQEYLDFLLQKAFNNNLFMHRVEHLLKDEQSLFWAEFDENVKQILGDEIDHRHFFGEFDIRLSSTELQFAVSRKSLLDYQRSINHNVTRAPSKLPDAKSIKLQYIISKNKPTTKRRRPNTRSHSLEGGNNKTKRHRKTMRQKNYMRK
jgi:serine/threonine protein kinase